MSDLIDALTKGLTGRAQPDTAGMLRDLIAGAGKRGRPSAAGAARLIGVPDTTVYRWRNFFDNKPRGVKQQPSAPHRKAIVAAWRRMHLPESKERRIRDKGLTMVIEGSAGISTMRQQKMHAGRTGQEGGFPEEVMGEILDQWLAGDDEAAEETIRDAIDDFYVAGMVIESVDNIDFEENE